MPARAARSSMAPVSTVPRRPDHEERRQTRVAVLRNRRLERVDIDLMEVVGGNDMQRRAAEAGQVHGLRNTAVRGRRRIGDEAFAGRCDAVAAHLDTQFAGARDQHAEQIGPVSYTHLTLPTTYPV